MKSNMLALVLVMIGAVNTSMGVFNIDPIDSLGNATFDWVSKILYLVILVAVLNILFDRNFYLPFLGESVFPCNVLKEHVPENATTQVRVNVTPNTPVVYWAAEPGEFADRDWNQAYAKYTNSGITKSDARGVAVMSVREPTGYNVPGKSLSPHVHYRECLNNNMLGEVKTLLV